MMARDVVCSMHASQRISSLRPPLTSISPDDEQHVDAPQLDAVHHCPQVRRLLAGAQHGAALQLDAVNAAGSQDHRLAGVVVEAGEAVADAVNVAFRDLQVGDRTVTHCTALYSTVHTLV